MGSPPSTAARSSPSDGSRREVDTIISAIGYRYGRSLLVQRVVGAGGTSLAETWEQSPRAYLGTAVPGFPNFFILLGPNSIGINSVLFSLEAQIAYVLGALRTMERRGANRIEVRRQAFDRYVAECDRRSAGSVWTDGGCKAYYTDADGRNFAIYPGFASEYRQAHAPLRPCPVRPRHRLTPAHSMIFPPAMSSVMPVIQEDASEAKNSAAAATSPG